MTDNLIEALIADVRDLLGTSSVGLYEFLWILRGMDPALSDDALREQASGALRRLIHDGAGRLVLLTWPSEDVVGPYDLEHVRSTDWDDPTEQKPYLAITRN